MEASGWSINFGHIMQHFDDACSPNGNSWYSWDTNDSVGSMSYIFSGTGTFKLKFANCWTDDPGHAAVYYDGAEIGRSTGDVQTIEQSFEDGKLLELKDEGVNSVLRIAEFITTPTCDESEEDTGKKLFLFFNAVSLL